MTLCPNNETVSQKFYGFIVGFYLIFTAQLRLRCQENLNRVCKMVFINTCVITRMHTYSYTFSVIFKKFWTVCAHLIVFNLVISHWVVKDSGQISHLLLCKCQTDFIWICKQLQCRMCFQSSLLLFFILLDHSLVISHPVSQAWAHTLQQ